MFIVQFIPISLEKNACWLNAEQLIPFLFKIPSRTFFMPLITFAPSVQIEGNLFLSTKTKKLSTSIYDFNCNNLIFDSFPLMLPKNPRLAS